MTEQKWEKLGARNLSILNWSGLFHGIKEGTRVRSLYFFLKKYLSVFYGQPPSIDFIPSQPLFETNMDDLVKQKSPELNDILKDIENQIEKDLDLSPDSQNRSLYEFYKAYKKECGFMYAGYFLTQISMDRLKEVLGESEFNKIKDRVAIPHKTTMVGKEHHALEEAKKKYQRGSINESEVRQEAKRLAEKFGFIHSEYCGEEWKVEDYVHEIKESSPVEEKKNESLQDIRYSDEYLNWLVDIIRRTSYMFDESKSALVKANWSLRKTIENMGFDESKITNCTEDEFLEWINSRNLPKDFSQRKEYFAFLLKDNQLHEVFGKKKVEKIIYKEEINEFGAFNEEINTLKGSVAFKGKVRGRVRITYTQEDADNLKEGEILVSGMTTPELIRGMRRAAAFITDEGGLLCHAAIVAREMKKPCIIGAEIATKALGDGDMVEVDAEEGVVKVLERAYG